MEMVENLQSGVRKIGVSIVRIEMKEIGLPRSMVRAMAGEAEAKVQSQAKLAMSRGEAVANNKLVEAGDNLDVVSLHLRYLQTMMRISQPHVSISKSVFSTLIGRSPTRLDSHWSRASASNLMPMP